MKTRRSPGSSGSHAYDRRLKKEALIALANALMLPFLRAARRGSKIVSMYQRVVEKLVEYHVSGDRNLVLVILYLPCGPPAAYGLYLTAQNWYIRPYEVERRVRRLMKFARKRLPPQCDLYTAVVGRRATSGAAKLMVRLGAPFRTPRQFKRDVLRYWYKRYVRLKMALQGKRVFGELTILAWMLGLILNEHAGGDATLCLDAGLDAYMAAREGSAADELFDLIEQKCAIPPPEKLEALPEPPVQVGA